MRGRRVAGPHGRLRQSTPMTELHQLCGVDLLVGYRAGTFGPVDVTRAVLARIDAWEPHLHATYALDAACALAQADASQARWAKGEPIGALDGVPVTLIEALHCMNSQESIYG